MILILSRRDDGSSREVCEWLRAIGKKFIRLNADDNSNCFLGCDLTKRKFSFMINDEVHLFCLNEIESAWHRRKGFSNQKSYLRSGLGKIFHDRSSTAEDYVKEEVSVVSDYLYYLLESNPRIRNIGSQFYNSVNKLMVLDIATSFGLKIPDSYILSSKTELSELFKKEKNLVTKAIANGVYRFSNEFGYYSYTEKISAAFINNLPGTFLPSLIQKEVDKQYELRVFFLEEEWYSMAIFSQETEATAVDSRKNFEAKCMPRRVPYLLPGEIKSQLRLLMKKLKLNTGSVDMVVAKNGDYYFLEVNPIGQFGMVSHPCNYYLEKKIAERL